MIQPTASFKENLKLLPSVEGLARIDILDHSETVIDSIENLPGKQGSLVVYSYLAEEFAELSKDAAEHGMLVFGEHTLDAKNRPGAHPNIDRLSAIVDGSAPLNIRVVKA